MEAYYYFTLIVIEDRTQDSYIIVQKLGKACTILLEEKTEQCTSQSGRTTSLPFNSYEISAKAGTAATFRCFRFAEILQSSPSKQSNSP